MSTHQITVKVNGQPHTAQVEARLLLVHFLRETLNLTGTHIGCDTTSCGACTVLLNGRAVKSCTVFAVQADGAEVTTVESLVDASGALHPIQAAFIEQHGLQCGFCTPGMILSCTALLESNRSPTDGDVRAAVAGNLCRCGTYTHVFDACRTAAATMREAVR